MRSIFLLFFICFSLFALAHEGHEGKEAAAEEVQEGVNESAQPGRPKTWIKWIGGLHLIALHFPIALINLLVVSECLLIWSRRPLFDCSARFLIISAALLTPLTAILGIIYSYSASYTGFMETFLLWHMWFGISTAVLVIIGAFIREYIGLSKLYYTCLILLFLMINITGYFGGGMTFGPYSLYPPR